MSVQVCGKERDIKKQWKSLLEKEKPSNIVSLPFAHLAEVSYTSPLLHLVPPPSGLLGQEADCSELQEQITKG